MPQTKEEERAQLRRLRDSPDVVLEELSKAGDDISLKQKYFLAANFIVYKPQKLAEFFGITGMHEACTVSKPLGPRVLHRTGLLCPKYFADVLRVLVDKVGDKKAFEYCALTDSHGRNLAHSIASVQPEYLTVLFDEFGDKALELSRETDKSGQNVAHILARCKREFPVHLFKDFSELLQEPDRRGYSPVHYIAAVNPQFLMYVIELLDAAAPGALAAKTVIDDLCVADILYIATLNPRLLRDLRWPIDYVAKRALIVRMLRGEDVVDIRTKEKFLKPLVSVVEILLTYNCADALFEVSTTMYHYKSFCDFIRAHPSENVSEEIQRISAMFDPYLDRDTENLVEIEDRIEYRERNYSDVEIELAPMRAYR